MTNFLVAQDYLEMPLGKGEWSANPRKRRTTRYRATERLISLCEDYGINRFMITTYAEPEIIILKDKKAKNQSSGLVIDYQDTAFTLQARKNLKKINDFIGKQCLNLDITDKQHNDLLTRLRQHTDIHKAQYIDFTKTALRRIFNNASFEQGGRFYGAWWQKIPSDYRLFITINGKKTSQLDYSGMHFSIMYAQVGMDLPMDDPYALDGYDASLRNDIKVAFNAIVNCKSERQAIQTVNYYIRQGELSLELISGEKVIEEFIKLHPAIKDKIASGEGIKGHFIDSQIAEKILLKGVDYDIPILPIHDGFITTASSAHILHDWMLDSFKEITGHSVNVKPETFNLSILDNAGQHPYWITRKDGASERDGSLEGKAISYSTLPNKHTLEKLLREDTLYKNYRNTINKDWNAVYE